MSWYHDLRQKIAEKEILLLLRLRAPVGIYRIYGEYAVEPLIHAFKVEKPWRYDALDPLVRMGPAIVPALLAHMKDDDLTRSWMLSTLGHLITRYPDNDWKGLLPVFAGCLEDGQDYSVQRSAIWPLGLLGAPGLAVLAKALGKENGSYAQDELVKIGLPSVPFLLDCLKDDKSPARARAAEALGWIAAKHPQHDWSEAIPLLVGGLGGNDYGFKKEAAFALGKMGDASAIRPLVTLLASEYYLSNTAMSDYLNKTVICAIGNLAERHPEYDWSDAVKALFAQFRSWITHEERRELILDAFKKIGPQMVPVLIEALKCEDNNVSWNATGVLEDIAGKTGRVDLKEVREALDDFFHTVRKKGDRTDMAQAKRKAAQQYLVISRALTKFRCSISTGMEGVLLEGTVKPPSEKMYRAARKKRTMT